MSPKAHVLVIDDDPIVRRSCERILRDSCSLRLVESGREGLELLAGGTFHLALVDLKLTDMDGMEILRQAPDRFPDLPIIIITGYSTVKGAVEAVKLGAFDYVAKPFTPEELLATVEKALRQRRLLTDYRRMQDTLADGYRLSRLVGESAAMRQVLTLAQQVAATDTTVLVTGESGTGKELVARAIHFLSARKDKRLVTVDCGAISPGLIASELFGHVKGAFTGAESDRTGLIQTAEGGTLFLDEIGNLPPDLQAMLLRVIEGRQMRPVGSAAAVKVDVRLITATNRDLRSLVKEGKFREDLRYRLDVFPIHIPPLRDRREDIPLLARYFLGVFSARMHKRLGDFTPEAINVLMQYDWPGNVRELSNVVERLVIRCSEGPVGQSHLRQSMTLASDPLPVPQTAAEFNERKEELRDEAVAELEKAFLLEALRRNDFNVTRAAQRAGMQRTSFQALLRKHGLRIRDMQKEP